MADPVPGTEEEPPVVADDAAEAASEPSPEAAAAPDNEGASDSYPDTNPLSVVIAAVVDEVQALAEKLRVTIDFAGEYECYEETIDVHATHLFCVWKECFAYAHCS